MILLLVNGPQLSLEVGTLLSMSEQESNEAQEIKERFR
jgi:hypothetical protein